MAPTRKHKSELHFSTTCFEQKYFFFCGHKRLFGYAPRQKCQGQTPFRESTTFPYSSISRSFRDKGINFLSCWARSNASHCFQFHYLWSADPCKVPEPSLVCPHDPLHTLVSHSLCHRIKTIEANKVNTTPSFPVQPPPPFALLCTLCHPNPSFSGMNWETGEMFRLLAF